MKRPVWRMAFTAVMVLLIAVIHKETSVAESTADGPAPIKIYIDGDPVDFGAEPVMEEGTTLVPFRVLFEKLGFAVAWDGAERKVTARKAGLTIELPLDGNTAIVNGQPLAMAVPPFIRGNITYVPLRFVAEQTGREAGWDESAREIYIADTPGMIAHVLDKHLTALAQGDRDACLRTLTANAAAEAAFAAAPISRETDAEKPAASPPFFSFSSRLLERKADQALAEVIVVVHENGGPDSPAGNRPLERITAHYRMVREKGAWKVDGRDVRREEHVAAMKNRTIDRPDLEHAPAWSDEDRIAILNLLEQSRRNLETGNMHAERLLYAEDFPGLEERLREAADLLARHEIAVHLGEVEGVAGSGGEVVVTFSILVEKVSGPYFKDVIVTNEATLIKDADGAWKVAALQWLERDYRMDRIIDFLRAVRK